MLKVAIVGLDCNEVWDFYNFLKVKEKELSTEFFPLIYTSKSKNLYDTLVKKGFNTEDFSAAVSVGGDGTFLYTSRVFAGTEIPIFGVNKGHLGFNTNIEEKEFLNYFLKYKNGDINFDYKSLLDINIENDENKYIVLNEAVVSHTGISRMIRLKVFLDDIPVCDFRGDGLIVSSPTGSTAYNLSAGGPILHPSVNAYVVCPICPHTLAIRPYIIPFDETINIKVEESSSQPQITLDGQKIILLNEGQKIRINKSNKRVKIVRGSKNFTEILETKLGWMI